MSEIVVVALLSLIGTITGSFAGILVANKLVNYRLDQIEKKLDKNTEKQEETTERLVVVEQSARSAHHRIDDVVQQLNIHERRD